MDDTAIIEEFRGPAPDPDSDWDVDFLGVRTRRSFLSGIPHSEPPFPSPHENYFEWIDLLEAVKEARARFVMVELGAGFGRWCVRAAAALRRVNPMPFHLVAVEPEPTHFLWLEQHLRDNGVDPRDHELIEAAVTVHGEPVPFWVGDPGGWYGQAIAAQTRRSRNPLRRLRTWVKGRVQEGRARRGTAEVAVIDIPSVTLPELLARQSRVDLLDLDVQGVEADILEAAAEAMDRKVRRVHVGTHGPEIEDRLRSLFDSLGWAPRNDFACLGRRATPVGEIEFVDGVQTWINPKRV